MMKIPDPAPLALHRPGVWIKASWLRFSGITLQTRMVVLKVQDGLALYSPSPATLDAAAVEELRAQGEPRWLIAPNEIHNVGLRAFQAAFPEAHTTGCEGHPRRVKGVKFDVLLGAGSAADAVPWTRSGELKLHVIGGNRLLHEIAVLHVPSKTLVLTDAIELIDPDTHLEGGGPNAVMTWLMKRMGLRMGVPCMSPEHFAFCEDPDALEASAEVLDAWDFDSLVIAHGRILEGDEAHRAVRDAFAKVVSTARSRGAPSRAFWRVMSRLG